MTRELTRESHPDLFAAIETMVANEPHEPFRLPDHRYGRPPTQRERARERAQRTATHLLLLAIVTTEAVNRHRVRVALAAILGLMIGALALIGSRPA